MVVRLDELYLLTVKVKTPFQHQTQITYDFGTLPVGRSTPPSEEYERIQNSGAPGPRPNQCNLITASPKDPMITHRSAVATQHGLYRSQMSVVWVILVGFHISILAC